MWSERCSGTGAPALGPGLDRSSRLPVHEDASAHRRTTFSALLDLQSRAELPFPSCYFGPEEVMRLLREDPPDIILLDIDMPKLSGLEVLRRIQSESIDIGVIIISGHPDEEAAKKSLTMGASDFIVKPFDFSYLETSLMAKLLTLGFD